MFLFVFLLVVCILLIVTNWKIFSKAGKPGWASLIPFYNIYIMSDIAFGNLSYFIAIMISWVVSFLGGFLEISILSSLAGLASFVLYIIYCVKISKAFGKSGGFAVGLVLLPLIFFPILGLGSAEYIGPQ
ncbi:MAG TPA: signal peptidase I [Lachnoclostridium sp.]|nr:signal peptidase I [Lachnoclostridium sp.]